MNRVVAFVSYYLGLVVGLGWIITAARNGNVWSYLLLPVWGLIPWWIGAGIGIRLGVAPSEFWRTIANAAGLIDPPPPEREPDTPSKTVP